MQGQGHEQNGSESEYGKRHHPIENPPSPPNPDPPVNGAARPPYGGPEGGKGHHDKK